MTVAVRAALALVLALAACGARNPARPTGPPAAPLVGTTEGHVDWDGRRVDYRVWLRPDALAQLVDGGDRVIARTTTGNLVAIDRASWTISGREGAAFYRAGLLGAAARSTTRSH